MFCYVFNFVVDEEISFDVFSFVVNVVNCVSVSFFIGRCQIVYQQFVVCRFVDFVEVICFISRDESFSRIVDFFDILLELVLKFVVLVFKFDVFEYVVQVGFEVVEVVVMG